MPWLVFLFLLFILEPVWAEPTVEKYYPGASPVQLVHESGGRILIVSPDAFRQSFVEHRSSSNQGILLALKKAVSHLKRTQLQGIGVVSTAIQVSAPDSEVEGYVIPAYGRAHVLKINSTDGSPAVILDLKGPGAEVPTQGSDSNGLLSLPVALKEFVVAHLMGRLFEYAGIDLGVVPHIAVSASDFFIQREDGSKVLAAKLVRGPHRRLLRNDQSHFFVDFEPAIQIERVLNLFGISSLYSAMGRSFLNIQGTPTRQQEARVQQGGSIGGPVSRSQLFDFGHYRVSDEAIAFPPNAFAYFNALPGNSLGYVEHVFTSYFSEQNPRVGVIHNLLSGSGQDKMMDTINALYVESCPDSERCNKEKLFDSLSKWAETFIHQAEEQLKAKPFSELILDSLGPQEGFKVLAGIYPAFNLTPRGRSELQKVLADSRFNAGEIPEMELLRVKCDLKNQVTDDSDAHSKSYRTNFIRNISTKYSRQKVERTSDSYKETTESAIPLSSIQIPEDDDQVEEAETHICSRLAARIWNFFNKSGPKKVRDP